MSVNMTLLLVMGVLYAVGIYLLLERSLTRVLLGLMLLTNGTNILLLTTGGYAGLAPIFNKDIPADTYNDPLPQAFILTSIVISFAVTAFMLSLIYRSWLLSHADHIQVDREDIRVAKQELYDEEEDSEIAVEVSDFHENNHPEAKRETVPGVGTKKVAPVPEPDAPGADTPENPRTSEQHEQPGKDKE